ncbi:MAG: metal-dependent phosphohydrolase [Deltaproteobacteria bacterium]|nr:MAG: metal-dependent phosphohydrolase [Deltaproteobacteria bacterium]
MIPSISKCMDIINKYQMLDNIKAHSIMVTKVAYILGSFLVKSGNNVSIEKIVAASLLHDIGKTEAIKSGGDHTEIGMNICLENGFHEIADIIGEHVILKKFDMQSPCTEKEIVYYSDKRVNHDKVVGLDERLSYILERYAKGNSNMAKAIRRNFAICRKVEKKIFQRISLLPNDIPGLINQVIFNETKGLIGWQEEISYLQ